MPGSTIYEFTPYRLLPAQRQLVRDGTPVKLGGRAFDVLVALVERRERTVSKNELMDLAWPTVVVEENNLEVQIVTLRKLLGYPAIATVPGRGYRFTLPVAVDGGPAGTEQPGPVSEDHVISRSGYVSPPRPGSELIGRAKDVATIVRLLLEHRVVTLTGSGGIGKTRLAIEVARGQEALLNVAWADLSSVTNAEMVPVTVATALDVSITSTRDAVASIVVAMRRRPAVLLVIDNAEHLVDSTAEVVSALVAGVANLSVLTTSREPLRVDGEISYTVGGLGLPAKTASVSDAMDSEAVSLFLARAKAATSRFELIGDDIADVVALCGMLNGMPLAIELAAARAPVLGLKRLRALLTDSLSALTGNRRDAPARQQTMRSALDWSYRLLAPAEQSALRRAGVFAGGFTLDAFCSVAVDGVDEWEAVELLQGLVEKSLVAADSSNPPRYSLLETSRVYALEKLRDCGEEESTRKEHAVYFTRYFDSIYLDRHRVPERELTARAFPEMENLRAALGYSLLEERDPVQGIALLGSSLPVWLERRRQDSYEGRRYFDTAVRLADGVDLSTEMRGRLYLGVGIFHSFVDVERASAEFDEAIQAFRVCGDQESEAQALIDSAGVLARKDDLDTARAMLDQASVLLGQMNNPGLRAWYELCRGFTEHVSGNSYAIRHLRVAVKAFERLGSETKLLMALNAVGDAAWDCGDLLEAEKQFRMLVSRMETSDYAANDFLGTPLRNLAGVLIQAGAPMEGLSYATRGLPLLLEAGRSPFAYPHIALAFALVGEARQAARMQGFAVASREGGTLGTFEPNERRSLDRVGLLLRDMLAEAELVDLQKEGARMSADDALDLVLATAHRLGVSPTPVS